MHTFSDVATILTLSLIYVDGQLQAHLIYLNNKHGYILHYGSVLFFSVNLLFHQSLVWFNGLARRFPSYVMN